ncbi:MAG: hypothetical protein WKF91_11595 [Segetibacter sp.]
MFNFYTKIKVGMFVNNTNITWHEPIHQRNVRTQLAQINPLPLGGLTNYFAMDVRTTSTMTNGAKKITLFSKGKSNCGGTQTRWKSYLRTHSMKRGYR